MTSFDKDDNFIAEIDELDCSYTRYDAFFD